MKLRRLVRKMRPYRLPLLSIVGIGLVISLSTASQSLEGATALEKSFKSGAVFTREVVRDESGNPIYVEYDSAGNEVLGGLVLFDSPEIDYMVFSGERYRSMVAQYRYLKFNYSESGLPPPVLLDRASYLSATFTTLDNETITKPVLRDDTLTVVLAPESTRYSTNGDQLLLLQLPIDPRLPIQDNTNSVLINRADGSIVYETSNNIGYRVGFYGDGITVSGSQRRTYKDDIYGPLKGVSVGLVSFDRFTQTDDFGKYSIEYNLPPCPGFSYEMNSLVAVELNFKRFDPMGGPTRPYTLYRWGKESCYGYTTINYNGVTSDPEFVSGSSASVTKYLDFPVDIMVLNGRAILTNGEAGAISLGGTRFDSTRATPERIAQQAYDLDGDGASDTTELGKIHSDTDGSKRFVRAREGEPPQVQGIWLSSTSTPPTFTAEGVADTLPDLTRLPDWSSDFEDRALLSGLSVEDLGDTDLYVFRESDGSLLMERKGLDENERYLGVDESQGKFAYTLRLVGSRGRLYGGDLDSEQSENEFSQWQVDEGIVGNSPLYQREADHLRPGERVRIIAINRASGYLGSKSVALQAAGNGDALELSFDVEDIELLPPNLKVWAERQSRTELGMSEGEINNSLIGSEGAGMSDDTFIAIYSEWLDPDGLPLPQGLPDFGYTGRLAKVDAQGKLVAADYISNFVVTPGLKVHLLRLPEEILGQQHYYVQISGQPSSRNPSFENVGANGGILSKRPNKFVPFKIPLYDENLTNLSRQASVGTGNKVQPVYQWVYRPEFQFSVYELMAWELNRTDAAGQVSDILVLDKPLIEYDDTLLNLFYDLNRSDNPMPEAYGYEGERELAFSLGGEEVTAHIGFGQTIEFDDPAKLAELTRDDFLTLRLYANNDAANLLWEYVFITLDVAVDLNRNGRLDFSGAEHQEIDGQPDETKPTDKTTPTRPYRFWVNNDLDVVNHKGEIQWNDRYCTTGESGMNPGYQSTSADQYEQVCEQWDQDTYGGALTNTFPQERLRYIESYRDLEDFAPLAIHLGQAEVNSDYYLVMSAQHVNINLFKGTWRDDGEHRAHAYIYDKQMTAFQTSVANSIGGHIATLRSGQSKRFSAAEVQGLMDGKSVARLIFEGIDPNDGICASQPEDCYLSVALYKNDEALPLLERKVYLDLREVKDFYKTYTASSAEPEGFDGSNFGTDCYGTAPGYPPREPEDIHVAGGSDRWIYDALLTGNAAQQARKDRAILVHGWRMRDNEKKDFADTAFKRLYWLGYQGEFAALSWPTGWFYKPAHCYGTPSSANLAGLNSQNYDQSEVVARLTGKKLEKWLTYQRAPDTNLHLIAHSMGNVVVSEALRHHASGQLIESYSASQAAEVGGSYDDALGDMENAFDNKDGDNSEEYWYGNNTVATLQAIGYAMPPDIYRYTNLIGQVNGNNVIRHGKTTTDELKTLSEQLKQASGDGKAHYYRGIADKVGRIVNFFNTGDAALTAWEFNQLTKPDYLESFDSSEGSEWDYSNEQACKATYGPGGAVTGWRYPDGTPCPGPVDSRAEVTSRFYQDNTEIRWDPALPAVGEAYSAEQKNFLNMMGYIIPARTEALGQVNIKKEREENKVPLELINGFTDMSTGFTNSNQGHSAQFHGYLSEPERGRGNYWLRVMADGMRLDPLTLLDPYKQDDYSGLYSDKLKIEVNLQ